MGGEPEGVALRPVYGPGEDRNLTVDRWRGGSPPASGLRTGRGSQRRAAHPAPMARHGPASGLRTGRGSQRGLAHSRCLRPISSCVRSTDRARIATWRRRAEYPSDGCVRSTDRARIATAVTSRGRPWRPSCVRSTDRARIATRWHHSSRHADVLRPVYGPGEDRNPSDCGGSARTPRPASGLRTGRGSQRGQVEHRPEDARVCPCVRSHGPGEDRNGASKRREHRGPMTTASGLRTGRGSQPRSHGAGI